MDNQDDMWAVMEAYAWDNVIVADYGSLKCPPEGPHRFIPVFETRAQAVAWAGGDKHVARLRRDGAGRGVELTSHARKDTAV